MMPTPTAVRKLIARTAIAAAIIFLFAGCTTRAQNAPQENPPKPNVQPGQLPSQTPAPISPPPSATPQIPAQSQTPEPQTGTSKPMGQSDTRNRIRVRSDLVIVPVTVKNRDGALVGDLQRDEFRIFCDNVEQQIIFFTSDPFPLSAVVLIDNDLSIKSAEQVQKSLTAISAGFGPADEVALVTYNEFTNVVSDFSFNNDQLYTKLKRLELDSHFPGSPVGGPLTAGPTANGKNTETGQPTQLGVRQEPEHKDLDDAIYDAAQMLKGRGRDRRKIVFLISDGNNSHNNTHSFDQTMQLLLANDVAVYSISVGHAFMQKQTLRLEHYASRSGGDTFYAGKDRGLENLYSGVTEQARNQYTLTFSPQDTDRTKDFHTIEVRVRRPNLDVSTREGYYQSGQH
ncbi:MAG: VWA domain-containing protein [Candidatus Acidiferrales bacterium]